MARVLVAGGGGFIGRALVARLLARHDQVTILTRGATGERDGLHWLHWEPQSPAEPRLSDAFDAFVNLAGEPAVGVRYTERTKARIFASRVDSTAWLVRAIERAEHKPRVFVAGSAIGYYGSALDAPRVDESAPAGTDFLAQVCVAWEAAAERAEVFGVRVVRARTGIVLGARGGALESLLRPFKLFVGGPIGSGQQGFSWIHLDDEVAALLRCIDDDSLRGAVNLCAPEPVSNAELSRVIGELLHRPASLRAPGFALKALFGEGAEPLLGGQWGVPRALWQAGFEFRYAEIRSALRAVLGVEQRR
ncbi:MAG TPA: TIGR01777 family oxidoreductase [Polyangiaceae bacterium]|jgi:uncharacterized protein (TIGR01777 family)|nr:TIGR01777 family oxidoreductase [Polyangiaceae bacterium]